MPRDLASDQGLHCLSITLLVVSRLQWVIFQFPIYYLIPSKMVWE